MFIRSSFYTADQHVIMIRIAKPNAKQMKEHPERRH